MHFAFADLELDAERHELRRSGQIVKTDATVVRLLVALVSRAPKLVTKEELVEEVWEGRAVAENVLTVAMARLRKMLSQQRGDREFIVTSYGRGYRFVYPLERRHSVERVAPKLDDGSDGASTLVGRDRSLAVLRRAVQRARAGRGQVCTLMGEPGIGKTHLVEALERELTGSRVGVAWGFCREAGDTPPLGPWLRLIREVTSTAARLDWDLRAEPVAIELESMLHALDMRDMDDAQLSEVIEHLCLRGPRRHHLFDTIARFLTRAAEHIPWVLVLEDLHRVDDASLALLHHMLDEITHSRIVVLATIRSGETRGALRTHARLPQVLGHRNCERLVLERLSQREVATYVAGVLDDADGKLGRAVYAKSEGNPFYMAELTRQLVTTGQFDPRAVTLPTVSLDLIRQHLARLDPATRDVLACAAVIGRSFELSLLRAITGLGPSALMVQMDEAIAAEIVIAAPDSKTGFAFAHELLRTVLYDALSPAERRRTHLQIAEELEIRVKTGDAAQPSELAHHFYAAMPETDLYKTVHFCRMAAASAAVASANADVVRYIHQALEALQQLERPSVRLRMHLLYVISMCARWFSASEFTQATSELLALAREHESGPMLVCAATMLNLHPGLKPLPGADSALRLALELLPEDNLNLRASAMASLATSAPTCFTERAVTLVDEAVTRAHEDNTRLTRYVCMLAQLYLRGGPDDPARATHIADELELLSQRYATLMPLLPVDLSFYRAVTALQRGDVAALRVSVERATARCRALEHAELLWHCQRLEALTKINTGDLAGTSELAALHQRAEQRAFFGTDVFAAFDRIVVLGELSGAQPELDDELRRTLAYAPSEPPNIWALKLRALSTAGLLTEAHAMLRAGALPENLSRLPHDTSYLGTLGHLAYTATRLADYAYAEALYTLLEPYGTYFSAQISFHCEGPVPHLLGMLARMLGRDARAIEHLEEGIAMSDRAGFAPAAARGRLELAECLLQRGRDDDREQAAALRRQAAVYAGRFGMRYVTSETGAPAPLALPQ